MLTIVIPAVEQYDEVNEVFVTSKETKLQLEHSLVSLSKWEAKWFKPFLSKEKKTMVETVDYIRCMTITQNIDPIIYNFVTNEIIDEVSEYINKSMTATTVSQRDNIRNREIITAEIIYYWMIALQIPFECQKWHLNRLLTLINVCSIKSQKPKPMSKQELMMRYASLNAKRRNLLNSKG